MKCSARPSRQTHRNRAVFIDNKLTLLSRDDDEYGFNASRSRSPYQSSSSRSAGGSGSGAPIEPYRESWHRFFWPKICLAENLFGGNFFPPNEFSAERIFRETNFFSKSNEYCSICFKNVYQNLLLYLANRDNI